MSLPSVDEPPNCAVQYLGPGSLRFAIRGQWIPSGRIDPADITIGWRTDWADRVLVLATRAYAF